MQGGDLPDMPKQYLPIDGQPLILHTLSRLASHPGISGIVIAISAVDSWFGQLDLADINRLLDVPLLTTAGGVSRSESVAAATDYLMQHLGDSAESAWVLVHDAARPCVRLADIDQLLECCDDQGGLLAMEVTDTLWQVEGDQRCQRTLPRDQLRRAVTPQFFPLLGLNSALARCQREQFQPTDEAEAMVRAGFHPRLVVGSGDNIKVTRREDLALAEFYLRRQSPVSAEPQSHRKNRDRGLNRQSQKKVSQ